MLAQTRQAIGWQHPVGTLSHLGKWRLVGNTRVQKELEYFGALREVVVRFNPMPINGFFGGGCGFVSVTRDQRTKSAQQIIVQPLIAIVDKAQQIKMHHLRAHALELVDGVVVDQ